MRKPEPTHGSFTRTIHAEEIGFLNNLIIDMSLSLSVKPHRAIDWPRLKEFRRVIDRLSQCKERLRRR